ncbi:hypothetical protein TCAL_07767 [Tigriopus californicus]|uniref:Uncharacterized protein n=1 Tax=Tigriopus californicus TaxID=6832 RepID=A0A553P604_TIGCA|nr:glutathione S-transferase 1-like [Tigriopus californicus]TRY73070.1 hypothetical protein TCAL_07767 [Tigriopus californicus]|eukprot:TCALIF_07767-PA protein Name:"Similar to Gst1 Glutathione S-transferase 1 (Musca domestica)" AED:0.02 eAED:0.02 QI:200/1/1/1/1/1/3/40/220
MVVELHAMPASSPCRLVHMALEVMDVPYEYKTMNLMVGDHMTPEYLKLNPTHKVPIIKDGDFVLGESRAIVTYLASVYDKTGTLYPQDPKVRAVVDQRLYFDAGTMYTSFRECFYPKMFLGQDIPDSAFTKAREVLSWAQDMVKATGYAAGTTHMTLADLAFVATYSTAEATGAFDFSGFPVWDEYFAKMKKEIKNYDKGNGDNAKVFGNFYRSRVATKA